MDIPAFHPEWIVTFWLTTPGLNKVDPHLLLVLLLASLIAVFYVKRRNRINVKLDTDEERFQHLLLKKNMLEKELLELKKNHEEEKNPREQLLQKKKELEKHLDLTKKELQQYT